MAQEKQLSADNAVFIGTYTKKEGHVDGKADGIVRFLQDDKTGELFGRETVAVQTNPSYVTISPDQKFLFAVSELGPKDAEFGNIFSYRITQDGLEEISKLSTGGLAPAHVTTDLKGKLLFVSNYLGGVVMVYSIDKEGNLEKAKTIELENPEKSHAHSVTLSPDNEHFYVADLGNDKIWIFNLSRDGKIEPGEQAFVDLPKGSGPRHFAISDNGKFAYSINELNSTISVFKVSQEGQLEILEHESTLPGDFDAENYTADIHIGPKGDFIYASNRGHNSIVSFEVDTITGKIGKKEFYSTQGKTPRSFVISPDGKYLYVANQDSSTITSFRIKEGILVPINELTEVPTPVSFSFQTLK